MVGVAALLGNRISPGDRVYVRRHRVHDVEHRFDAKLIDGENRGGAFQLRNIIRFYHRVATGVAGPY